MRNLHLIPDHMHEAVEMWVKRAEPHPLMLGSSPREPHVIRLYCSPDSSEVSDEYASFHEALSDTRQPPKDASLVDNGTTLALEYRDRWSLTSHGIRTLTKEYNALTGRHE